MMFLIMHKSLNIFAAVTVTALAFTLAIQPASATIVTVPTGLNPGDTYYLAFVTAGTITGTSTDIADYNNFAQSQAAGAGLNTISGSAVTWKAAVSTPTVSAVSNLGLGAFPIYLINDTQIATSGSALWAGALLNPVNVDQNETVYGGGVAAWTGSLSTGLAYNPYQLGTATPIIGAVSSTSSTWMVVNAVNAANTQRVYAFSSPLIVPVPEPSSTAIVIAAVGSITGWRLRRWKEGRRHDDHRLTGGTISPRRWPPSPS
jgi:hypothetical protein